MYNEIIYNPPTPKGPGEAYWTAPVASVTNLPVTALDGECKLVLDVDTIYTYDATTSSWKPIGGSGNSNFTVGPTPPTNPLNAQLWGDNINSVLYQYDAVRGKWLGLNELRVSGGRNNANVTNIFLRTFGNMPTNLASEIIPYNATLVGMAATNRGGLLLTWNAEVYQNGTLLYSLPIVNSDFAVNMSLNVDVLANDKISLRCNGTNINRPLITAIFRRRP